MDFVDGRFLEISIHAALEFLVQLKKGWCGILDCSVDTSETVYYKNDVRRTSPMCHQGVSLWQVKSSGVRQSTIYKSLLGSKGLIKLLHIQHKVAPTQTKIKNK